MSHRLSSFVPVIGLAIALFAPGAVRGQECSSGCGAALKTCVRNARADAFSCKLDCLSAPADGRRACVQACADTARAARTSCQSQVPGCTGTCDPPAITSDQRTCLAACGTSLGDCARTVLGDARTCLAPCRDAADRASCWRDCIGGAQSGASGCATDLNVCAAGCGVTLPPPPTPPPGGTCTAQCGSDLTHCLAGVGSAAFTCAQGCFGNANFFQCLLDCRAPAEQGATECRGTFDTCTAACAG